jgi:thiosulfate/3-mercaptopyruvate sulfurtransferase
MPVVLSPQEAVAVRGALVVDLSKPERYAEAHLPGAVPLDYASLVRSETPVGGLLPSAPVLSALLGGLGLAPGRPLIAYDDEGNGRAARLVWTLAAVGHRAAAILDGGLAAWREAGLATSRTPVAPVAAAFEARYTGEAVADRAWILAHLQDPSSVLVDTRSPAEYRGEDLRAARGGHIPGALSFDWVRAMDTDRHRCLRPAGALREELAALGVVPEREVIVYCQTHHRSSHTWVVLRSLGYERVRGYPGAWSDWGNAPDTPIRTGPDP